ASVGGGPQGALVGGIVAGIGLVSAATARNKKAAEDAAAANQNFLDILKQFKTLNEAKPSLIQQVTDDLLKIDRSGSLDILKRSGFNVSTFVDQMTKSGANFGTTIRQLLSGLNVIDKAIVDFVNSEAVAGRSTAQALDDLQNAARGVRTASPAAKALID